MDSVSTADRNASVPQAWILPITSVEPTAGQSRDWATFWMCFLGGTILTLSYATIKSKHTKVHDDILLNSAFIQLLLGAMQALMIKFTGVRTLNPAIASAYIFFETTQYNSPNVDFDSSVLNKYLWCYYLGPCLGAALGGILHMIHIKCSNTKGRDNNEEQLID